MDKQKVLIVDDDESVVEYLHTALELSHYEATTETTPTRALAAVRSLPGGFPVVLTDIMMPEMDGIELLRAIKKQYPETIVIMLTAHASVESAIGALNEGAFAYLRKPVDVGELKAVLRNAFDRFNLKKENLKLMEELEKAKEYSETIVQNLVYTVVATDSSGCIKKVNKAMESILRYKEEELIGMPMETIFTDEFKKTAWIDLVSKKYVKDFAVAFRTKDGHTVDAMFSGTVMKNSKGQVLGFLGTATL